MHRRAAAIPKSYFWGLARLCWK